MMNERQLIAEKLSAGYDSKTVVRGVDIAIPSGKISVIIGANGCGKSTLLKTFARLIRPTDGTVLLDGKAVTAYPSKQLAQTLGLLSQSPVVPEGITVFDLVCRGRFPYRVPMRGMSTADYDAVNDALSTMGVLELADRSVDELSGGQRQRVWIALALAQQTDILLLDEPTTYLDIAYQVEILDLLTDLNRRRGTTIVMVLHDLNLSARYADYLFAVRDGVLAAQGTPAEIMTPDLVERIFGLRCMVIDDPAAHSPLVIPIGRYHSGGTA